jgi:hypothetical protein
MFGLLKFAWRHKGKIILFSYGLACAVPAYIEAQFDQKSAQAKNYVIDKVPGADEFFDEEEVPNLWLKTGQYTAQNMAAPLVYVWNEVVGEEAALDFNFDWADIITVEEGGAKGKNVKALEEWERIFIEAERNMWGDDIPEHIEKRLNKRLLELE